MRQLFEWQPIARLNDPTFHQWHNFSNTPGCHCSLPYYQSKVSWMRLQGIVSSLRYTYASVWCCHVATWRAVNDVTKLRSVVIINRHKEFTDNDFNITMPSVAFDKLPNWKCGGFFLCTLSQHGSTEDIMSLIYYNHSGNINLGRFPIKGHYRRYKL